MYLRYISSQENGKCRYHTFFGCKSGNQCRGNAPVAKTKWFKKRRRKASNYCQQAFVR